MPRKLKNKPLRRYSAHNLLQRLPANDTQAAHALGVRRATIITWRTENTMLTCWMADKYALRIGYHPAQLWSDWAEIYP